MPERTEGDPTPRTIESLALAMRSIEEKLSLQRDADKSAVQLLQDRADRQPTTERVAADLEALKDLTAVRFTALKELLDAMFEGNKTALDAALKTQKEASDEIKISFSKQFDSLKTMHDDLKDRINRSEGRSGGLSSAGAIVLGVASVIVAVVIVAGFVLAQT
jgi:hypothetical protein